MSRLILCALLCLSLHVKNAALLQHPSVENARSLLLLASGDGDEPLRQLKDALFEVTTSENREWIDKLEECFANRWR